MTQMTYTIQTCDIHCDSCKKSLEKVFICSMVPPVGYLWDCKLGTIKTRTTTSFSGLQKWWQQLTQQLRSELWPWTGGISGRRLWFFSMLFDKNKIKTNVKQICKTSLKVQCNYVCLTDSVVTGGKYKATYKQYEAFQCGNAKLYTTNIL